MDVWCSWPGALCNTKIDVTVRSPHPGRYKKAATTPAAAADAGARDKERRYGPEVWVLNFEPRGRLGSHGLATLQHLAAEANCWSATAQRRLASFWRTRLERVLLQSQAESLLLCLGAQLSCINRSAKMGAARRAVTQGSGDAAAVAAEAHGTVADMPCAETMEDGRRADTPGGADTVDVPALVQMPSSPFFPASTVQVGG